MHCKRRERERALDDSVAEEASTENVVHNEIEITAEEAIADYSCDQCDSDFNSVRTLRAHKAKGRKHKASA